jgi:hypothetical protein
MLVYPTVMLYPSNLIYVNLFDALHRGSGEMMQHKRLKVFWLIVLGVFVYEWFPEYIAPLLGGFNIVCLAARNTEWVSYVFGGANGNEGMGLLGFGVDWANITSAPFYLPLATQISQYIGFAVNYWLLPLIYYRSVPLPLIIWCIKLTIRSNAWHSKSFPFISQNLFCTLDLLVPAEPIY